MIRLAVRCRPELSEVVLAELLEVAPGGVEEERGSDFVEYAIYGVPGEVPTLPDLEAAAGDGLVEVKSTEVPDDWADRWRDFHEPTVIAGGRIVVRPSWTEGEAGQPAAGAPGIVVVVDPGQAFGTGAHATTRMCLELLLTVADEGRAAGSLVDLGTGSGVLAITGAKLGFAPVVGCDHEGPALEAAAANAEANGVELALERRNLRETPPPAARTTIANLTAPLLREVAKRLPAGPSASGLIVSGLLENEAAGVIAAFGESGWRERARLASGGWAAVRFEAASTSRPPA